MNIAGTSTATGDSFTFGASVARSLRGIGVSRVSDPMEFHIECTHCARARGCPDHTPAWVSDPEVKANCKAKSVLSESHTRTFLHDRIEDPEIPRNMIWPPQIGPLCVLDLHATRHCCIIILLLHIRSPKFVTDARRCF